MKLTDILAEGFNAQEWESKGYELPKYDLKAVRAKTFEEPTWVHFGAGNIFRAFTAAVFGGIGSMPGAMLGGILLGIIENFAKAYLSTQFSDAIVFGVLIIILLVKPAGLLGKYVPEKV